MAQTERSIASTPIQAQCPSNADSQEIPTEIPAPSSKENPPAVIELPKKSWAALVRPKEGEQAPGPIAPQGAPNMMAFIETSSEIKRRKEVRQFERLGEIMFSRNLTDRKLDHRALFLTPRGMINTGNTCYMNAVLQTLVFCPPFYHLLESLYIPSTTPDQPPELPPIVSCFVNLALSFQRMLNTGAKRANLRAEDASLDPSFVYDTLAEHATASSHQDMLSRRNQEDAQESLNHVLTLLHEEMVKAIESLADGPARMNAGNSVSDEWTSISKGQKKSTVRETGNSKESPLSYVFGGKLRSVRKQWGTKDTGSVEAFFMLDLPIYDNRICSVFQALERFMVTETLHGFQDRGREVNTSRQYRFEELPAVLILHLKYFEFTSTGGAVKLQKEITFDSTLKLPERWFADGHYNRAKSSYQLSAVIFHWGDGPDGGHYTACMFHPASPSGWVEANDSVISVVGFDYIRQAQYHRVPYLLFYRLQV